MADKEGKPLNIAPSRALVYAGMIPKLREIAREFGYSLSVHGSMATDLDLVAVPWVEDAKDPAEMIQALCEHYNLMIVVDRNRSQFGLKPHGRKVWTLLLHYQEGYDRQPHGDAPYLDISVLPRLCDFAPPVA